MGVKKIKLSIKEHNKLFKYRQVNWMTYYEITDDTNERDLVVRKYIRLPVSLIGTLLSPFAILFGGLPMMKELIKELWVNRKSGFDVFTVDREWFYAQLKEMRGSK